MPRNATLNCWVNKQERCDDANLGSDVYVFITCLPQIQQ